MPEMANAEENTVGTITNGSQSLGGSTPAINSASNYILAQASGDVKGEYSISDSDGNALSDGQLEFFKDSKIRDEDGNLMVVYHGTNEEFTVGKLHLYDITNKLRDSAHRINDVGRATWNDNSRWTDSLETESLNQYYYTKNDTESQEVSRNNIDGDIQYSLL